ncbi:peptide deformylase [Limnobacter parvus]|uniref:Peptide deformylase n=1 Tax=Limnobacter parvus TaxID=2939690 RepID=A0ABT1XJJ0_9BURK|nr:peptide deformylase [Limnobacter parvus]MCR2747329.1 peptide deformylase [Limnobacter parvus]
MALLPILRYPDPRLKTVATPVTQFDDALVKLTQDMAETMYDAPGVGLAATQVNVHKRIIVIDVTDDNSGLTVFINPEIIDASKESKVYEEGCLSVPGIYEKVERPDTVKVRAQNVKGEWFEIDCDELLAVCIQHEIDHLNGKVFVEYLSQLKQTRIKNKIKKQDKLQTA